MEQLNAIAKDAADQYEEDCADYGAREHFVDGWKAAMKACGADHCTPEERAVIEAVIEWKQSFGFIGNEARWTELSQAADNLLTARAKKGEVK